MTNTLDRPTSVALRTYNGQYVCAEGGGGQHLVANRSQIGEWETFTLIPLDGHNIALRAHNGQYVCAEGLGGLQLFANRFQIHEWAIFTLVRVDGDKIALRAHNSLFVCAEGGGGQELVADRDQALGWESFSLIHVETGTVAAFYVTVDHLKRLSASGKKFFGRIDVQVFNDAGRPRGDKQRLWSLGRRSAVRLYKDARFGLGHRLGVTIDDYDAVRDTAYVELSGSLVERGLRKKHDDTLLAPAKRLYLNNVRSGPQSVTMRFQVHAYTVEAAFTVEAIPPSEIRVTQKEPKRN